MYGCVCVECTLVGLVDSRQSKRKTMADIVWDGTLADIGAYVGQTEQPRNSESWLGKDGLSCQAFGLSLGRTNQKGNVR